MKKKMRVICALLLCCSLGLSSGLSVTASDQPALMSEDAESDEVLDAVYLNGISFCGLCHHLGKWLKGRFR